jgi:hypothetical protein
METKYKELKLAFYECKDGTPEYKIARTELIHFERELIAKVLSGDRSFSHTIRELPATYLEVATDTHYSSEKDIQEFREDIINWFMAKGFVGFAEALEKSLTSGEYGHGLEYCHF